MNLMNTNKLSERMTKYSKSLAILALMLYGISLVFPIGAGVFPRSALPQFWWFADVSFAFLFGVAMVVIIGLYNNKIDSSTRQQSYAIYRQLSYLLLIFLLLDMFGQNVNWQAFLPGIVWRVWFLIYATPHLLMALKEKRD